MKVFEERNDGCRCVFLISQVCFAKKKKKKRYDGIKPKTSLNIIYLISLFVFIDVGFFYYVLSLWIQSITNIYL